jgi:carbonic anhydrase
LAKELAWEDALDRQPQGRIRSSLAELYEGHQRFLNHETIHRHYHPDHLEELVKSPRPIAAIVACSDSRVAPEVVFDQGLGQLFVSRVPGNVASDGTKWMLEIAVSELKVPLVMVMGHTGCLAVGQSVEGRIGWAGGTLRFDVQKAVHRARILGEPDVFLSAVRENVALTIENLHRESYASQKAIQNGELGIVGCVYDMETGIVQLIDS